MSRRPTLLAVLSLLLSIPAGAQTEAGIEKVRSRCRKNVEHSIRLHHLEPARVDAEAICGRIVEQARSGFTNSVLEEQYQSEIRRIRYHYAKRAGQHDRSARYRYPFQAWMPRLLSQTSGGKTHTMPDQFHAFDFLMPTGTKILAARAGTVVEVGDGTAEGVPWQKDGGNFVVVLHADGTWGSYIHLQSGIPVKVGQKVKPGQHLANSGNTGFSFTPHLHFMVQRMTHSGKVRSEPIRFGKRGKAGYQLKEGHHWGVLPPSRRELRVSVDGTPSDPKTPMPITYGTRATLRVERVEPDGSILDVTTDGRMRYETMTVWSLYSGEPGKLIVEALPEIDRKYVDEAIPVINQSEGLLFVYHGLPWEPDFGLAQVPFLVLPPAAP